MTGNKNPERKALDRLDAALVDDILSASDEDILAEFREDCGNPDRHAAEMRTLFEMSIIAANKRRLAVAKTGAAASRVTRGAVAVMVDIADMRRRVRAILDTPDVASNITIAARKESELSDADILGLFEDLCELGVLPPDDRNDGKS